MTFKIAPVVVAISLLGMTSLPADAAWTAKNPNLDTIKLDKLLSQNQGGIGLPAAEMCGWFNAVTISGKINVDLLASNRTTVKHKSEVVVARNENSPVSFNRYYDKSSNDIQLTTAALFFDVAANTWTHAHIGINAHSNRAASENGLALVARDFDLPLFDEAYITVSNFAQSPFYARVGRQYATFGDYNVYPIVPRLTQTLSETNQTMVLAGYRDPSSFNANLYTFRGIPKATDSNNVRIQNYGATIGFGDLDTMGYKVGLGYLDNLADVAQIKHYLNNKGGHYNHRVHGLSTDVTFQSGPFDVAVNYLATLNRFDVHDIAEDTSFNDGAKPWAAGIDAGYSFNTLAHQSRFGLGYQQSGEAAFVGKVGLPEKRFQAEYAVNVSKNANLGFVVYHDKGYNVNDGGTNGSNTTGIVRLGVDLI